MPEYINPNNHPVILTGPNGELIKIASRQRVVLSDYYERYRKRGFLKLVNNTQSQNQVSHKIQSKVKLQIELNHKKKQQLQEEQSKIIEKQIEARKAERAKSQQIMRDRKKRSEEIAQKKASKCIVYKDKGKKHILGRAVNVDGNRILNENLPYGYPISNNIGVGILSYNRKSSLERLINSIIKYTDLNQTTVFISDDNSTDQQTIDYLNALPSDRFVVLKNLDRLGIAGNTNRLLHALSRFRYGLLLNDDVEVKEEGWDKFYFRHMDKTNMHHFIYRQEGVYGAEAGTHIDVNGVMLSYVDSRPQGSILAYSNALFKAIGYFDESYGLYGMEHVDWSRRAYESGMQRPGYFDIVGSSEYFHLYSEPSAVEGRIELLKDAKEKYKDKYTSSVREVVPYIDKSERVKLDSISYVIPFRNIDRTGAIETIVNNVKAQKFPYIDIIMVEHDITEKVSRDSVEPVNYALVKSEPNDLFNKSKVFNYGASLVNTDAFIMQDADIMLRNDYTSQVFNILKCYDACHIGKRVIYADEPSSSRIIAGRKVFSDTNIVRVVEYFEGGSLASKVDTYWRSGAFNEDYNGYGCEDCDFFARLSRYGSWYEVRVADLLHLHHGRVAGWEEHHNINKAIEQSLSARSLEERIELQYAQLRRLGYGKFIEKDQSYV